MDEQDIVINEDGSLSFVYSDTLADVFKSEPSTTRRASHVEPASDYGLLGGWIADMGPSNGPLLGVPTGAGLYGFETRQEALDAERTWLRKERGL